MFSIETVWESMKRRWLFIAIITILCLVAGAASSFLSRGETVVNTAYTAEAAIYASPYESSDEGTRYNYEASDDRSITDTRHVVLSNEVAGEVRRQLGSDVTVTSPFWMDLRTDARYYMHFTYVACSASTPEKALQACQLATDLAMQEIGKLPNIKESFVSSAPAISNMSERAMDWGSDPMPDLSAAAPATASVSNSISVKTLIVFGLAGFVLSALVFAAYDIFTRKVRCRHDVERLLEVPVLADLKGTDRLASVADDIKVLMAKNGLDSTVAVGCVSGDQVAEVAGKLADAGVNVAGQCLVTEDNDASAVLRDAVSAVLVLKGSAASGAALDELKNKLCIAETPVLGAVFLRK